MEHENFKFYKNWRTLLSTTHHTEIGILYLWTAFINFLMAGASASIMRLQLGGLTGIVTPDTYYSLVTLHGLAMLLFFVPPAFTGLANYVLPKMIGAPDLYWPKINALAFWMFASASVLLWSSLLVGHAPLGWTLYPPNSIIINDPGVDIVILAVVLVGISTVISAINFLMTILRLRHPSVEFKLSTLPLFVWAFLATILLIIVALPPLTIGGIMLVLERHWGAQFFMGTGDSLLWPHIFWFFGHPEVYILVLPAFGVISEVIPRMARKPLYGRRAVALSSILIAFISYFVWVHHMFTTPTSLAINIIFMVTTVAVAVPTGIKVFNWVATLYGGRIRVCSPMVFSLAFVGIFIIGGITGVWLAWIPFNYAVHGTYFVLAHFHFVVWPIVFAFIGGIYYYFPYITGKMFSEKLSKVSFVLLVIGVLGTYLPWIQLGLLGMPRRYYSYPSEYDFWQQISTIFTFFIVAGILVFIIDILRSIRNGKPVANKEDPWGGAKLGMPDFAPVKHEIALNGSAFEYHYPHPYPAIVGLLSSVATIGGYFLVIGNYAFGFIAIAAFLIPLVYWFAKDYLSSFSKLARYLAELSLEKLERAKRSDALIGTLWFIFSEAIIFGTAFTAYFFLRASYVARFGTWPPAGVHLVETFPVLINSIFLFTSGFTMHFAYLSFLKGNIRRFKILLYTTFVLGSIFIAGQVIEYINSGLSISDTIYGSTFYLITGLHGFHVIIGLVFMAALIAMLIKGFLSLERKAMVESATIYWHFVDIVWVFVLAIVYFNLAGVIASYCGIPF